MFCYMTLYPDADDHQEGGHDPLYAYKASTDPDTLYLHEAMKAEDLPNFRAAIQKEIDDRMEGKLCGRCAGKEISNPVPSKVQSTSKYLRIKNGERHPL